MDQQHKNGDENIYDIIIIGAGPAGLFGTFYAGLRKMKTLLIDALPELGGQLVTLYPEKYVYDMPGFPKILAKDLAHNLAEQAMQYEPTLRLQEQAQELRYIDKENHKIEVVTTKGSYQTRSVLLAAGVGAFRPNKLAADGLEEFENRGVYYFVQDLNIFKDKELLIVGGGDSAVDWALSLYPIAKKVTLIHRREGFRAHESSVEEMRASTVDVKIFYELHGVYGNDRVERAAIINNQTKEIEEINVDAVLLNLGFKADLGPIKDWGFEIDKRSVVVNSHQATSLPGVYAAGDIASSDVKLDLIAVGCGQAAVAVSSAKTYIDPAAKFFAGHSSSNH